MLFGFILHFNCFTFFKPISKKAIRCPKLQNYAKCQNKSCFYIYFTHFKHLYCIGYNLLPPSTKSIFFSIVSKYVYEYNTFHGEKSQKNMLQPRDTEKSKMAAIPPNSSPMALRPKILVSIIGFSDTADTLVPFKNMSSQCFTWNPRWRSPRAVAAILDFKWSTAMTYF